LQATARPFKPAQRLKAKSEFDRVYRDARRSADGSFAIFTRSNDGGIPRLGLSIAARVIGNAMNCRRSISWSTHALGRATRTTHPSCVASKNTGVR
jgi:ribonuclease P protein component